MWCQRVDSEAAKHVCVVQIMLQGGRHYYFVTVKQHVRVIHTRTTQVKHLHYD